MIYPEKLHNDTCWVYIKKDKNSSYKINLTGNIDVHVMDEQLVFYRLCPDTLMALGFCLVLRRLSQGSLEKVIQKEKYISKTIKQQSL